MSAPNAGLATLMRLLSLAALCACLVASVHADELVEGLNLHRKLTGTPGADGWYHAVSTLGSFEVDLPIPFNDATIKATETDGRVFYVHLVGSTSSDGIKFSINEMIALKPVEEDALEKFVATFSVRKDTEISDVRYQALDVYPACSFEIKRSETGAFCQQVALPDRVYTAIIEFPNDVRDAVVPIKQRVFESLKLKGMTGGSKSSGSSGTRD